MAGVHRATLYRWLDDPTFAGDVEAARAALLERLLDEALADAVESAAVLRELRDDPEAEPALRLRAAQTLYRTAMDGIRERLMPATATLTADVNGPREVTLEWPT